MGVCSIEGGESEYSLLCEVATAVPRSIFKETVLVEVVSAGLHVWNFEGGY